MTAPAQTIAPTDRARRAHGTAERAEQGAATPGGVQTRLPWWAVALPTAAFIMLLTILVGGGEANASGQAGDSVLVAVLERLRDVLLG